MYYYSGTLVQGYVLYFMSQGGILSIDSHNKHKKSPEFVLRAFFGTHMNMKRIPLVRTILLCVCALLVTGCASMSKLKNYSANELYRGYLAKDKVILALDGKIIHVEGMITRIDQSKLNDMFIELNSRVIVILRSDEIIKISKIGLKNGDTITIVGNFDGEGVLSKWLTNADNRVLVIENAQIIDKDCWYDLENFENPLFF